MATEKRLKTTGKRSRRSRALYHRRTAKVHRAGHLSDFSINHESATSDLSAIAFANRARQPVRNAGLCPDAGCHSRYFRLGCAIQSVFQLQFFHLAVRRTAGRTDTPKHDDARQVF